VDRSPLFIALNITFTATSAVNPACKRRSLASYTVPSSFISRSLAGGIGGNEIYTLFEGNRDSNE